MWSIWYFWSDFIETWSFMRYFWKSSDVKFRENCPVGVKLFHVVRWIDGWTYIVKLIVSLCNFANLQRDWEFTYRLHTRKWKSHIVPCGGLLPFKFLVADNWNKKTHANCVLLKGWQTKLSWPHVLNTGCICSIWICVWQFWRKGKWYS
jgi:uroporphyrinogen-III decarboxylase